MDEKTVKRYRYWRARGATARGALSYARWQEQRDAVLARLGEWTWETRPYGTFASAELEDTPEGYTLTVSVGDDDAVDWGDCEPTDEESQNARSYYVRVDVRDASGSDVYEDSIGGIDVIELEGHLQQDWEDAVAYALLDYLLRGAEDFMANESAERTHWAARDVITI